MHIPLFKKRLLVVLNKMRRWQSSARRSEEHPYFVMAAQSYARFVEALSAALAVDDAAFLSKIQSCVQDLKDNPVWDAHFNEVFCLYQQWLDDLETALADVEPCFLTCEHANINYGGFVSCRDCYETFGWFCETSPDKRCHYHTYSFPEGHGILLINGDVYKLDKNEHETSDACLFCGSPCERK